MKRYSFVIILATILASCTKSESFQADLFPGFSGSNNDASWVVFNHTITDASYLNATLPGNTPPTTLKALDSTLKVSVAKEVSPFSYRLSKGGAVATIQSNGTNSFTWANRSELKWEDSGLQMKILRQVGSQWIIVVDGFQDQEKMLLKFNKAFFGDNTPGQGKTVMEVYYTLFSTN